MRRPFLLAIFIAAAIPAVASAQTRSTLFSGSGGPSSAGGMGASYGGMSGMSGMSTGSSSGMFGSSMGGSSLGGTGLSSGFGATGSRSGGLMGGNSSGNAALGAASGQAILGANSIGTGAFVGRSDNAGRLVGQRLSQQGGMNMGSLMQGLQGLQGFGRNSGFENGQSSNSQQQKLSVRPTLRIGFDVPRSAAPAIATQRVATRLPTIAARRPELAGVSLASDGTGRTVLRGTVPNQEAGELAAALVRLEPGIGEVVNELTVAPAAAGTTP